MSSHHMILPSWNEVESRSSAASDQQAGSRKQNEPESFARAESRAHSQNAGRKPFGHYAQERGNDSQSSAQIGSADGRRGGFVDRDSMFDEFKYKELCLNAASRTKMTTTYLTKIRDHIVREASLEWEVAASYGSFMDENENVHNRYGRSYISSAPVPKEAMILENSSSELQTAASLCMKAVSECFHSRKTIYLTQLKKIRETSNMATRNAVQHERSEAGAYLNRLKESLEAQRKQEVRACEDKIVELENTILTLRATLETANAEVTRLSEIEANRVTLQNTAVAEALQHSRDEHARDRARLQTDCAAERQRLVEEAHAQVADMKRQNETQLEFQRQHEREMRELILQDKSRAEAETAKVREEHILTVAKLNSEKERGAARLQEERERAERDQQTALADAVKGQATLRAELAATLQRVKNEEQKRAAEQDTQLSKYREKLLTAHSLEIEKINERHRNELKKYHAELQVRSQDAISKLKHTHEQELNRLIRDNERLQRIIVRQGGAEHFRTAAAASLDASLDESVNASFFNAAQSPGMRFNAQSATSSSKGLLSKSPLYSRRVGDALTPPGKFRARAGRSPEGVGVTGVASAGAALHGNTGGSYGGGGNGGGNGGSHGQSKRTVNFGPEGGAADASDGRYGRQEEEEASRAEQRVPDSPPPPPRTSAASVLQWGELARSLQQQEDGEKAYSHLPPDPFALTESLSNSRAARNAPGRPGHMGVSIGIEENSRRVGDYTRELDQYLVNKGNASNKSGAVPMSVVKELPTLGSVLETSSHSSLNFNAQMAHHYQKSKERLGIAPKSPAYDSDSDADGGASSDSLYGEDITLSATRAP